MNDQITPGNLNTVALENVDSGKAKRLLKPALGALMIVKVQPTAAMHRTGHMWLSV